MTAYDDWAFGAHSKYDWDARGVPNVEVAQQAKRYEKIGHRSVESNSKIMNDEYQLIHTKAGEKSS